MEDLKKIQKQQEDYEKALLEKQQHLNDLLKPKSKSQPRRHKKGGNSSFLGVSREKAIFTIVSATLM